MEGAPAGPTLWCVSVGLCSGCGLVQPLRSAVNDLNTRVSGDFIPSRQSRAASCSGLVTGKKQRWDPLVLMRPTFQTNGFFPRKTAAVTALLTQIGTKPTGNKRGEDGGCRVVVKRPRQPRPRNDQNERVSRPFLVPVCF